MSVKRTYLIDVPESDEYGRYERRNIKVTITTENSQSNTEEFAQAVAEADWYDIRPDEYAKGFGDYLVPATLDEPFTTEVSYSGIKTSSFKEKLQALLSAEIQANSDVKVIKNIERLIVELPQEFLENRQYFGQVIPKLKLFLKHKVTEVAKDTVGFNPNLIGYQALYAIVCRYFHENLYDFYDKAYEEGFIVEVLPRQYWYDVREMLGQGTFYKVEADRTPNIYAGTKDFKVFVGQGKHGCVRFSIFDKDTLFNSWLMRFETKIMGLGSVFVGEETIPLSEGTYSIYSHDGLFAIVKKGET